MSDQALSIKSGACHCGVVSFQAHLPEEIIADECNCSICEKVGFMHVIVPKSRFEILTGEDHLTLYQFNTKVAQHMFCRHCGVKPFYIPRSNPDGYSVNLRCMDRAQFKKVTIRPFDGKNWEANAGALAHLSHE